jgi:Mrp family chromosome partitioning ATPase
MAGVQGALFVPGSHKVALPRNPNGIAVFSMGSVIPESEAVEFESAARGESHTWRATREFALLGEILGAFDWGALDLLMFDLPPGAERTVQYADFLRPFDKAQGKARTSFLLVTIPSEVARGVVARSVAALSNGGNRLLGYVENMSGYYCRDCNGIKPLFEGAPLDLRIPCLGTVPFDPELARHCDRGIPFTELLETPVRQALEHVAEQLLTRLE